MKKGDVRRIKKSRSYTVKEFSEVLHLNKVTVFRLIKLSKLESNGIYMSSKLYSGEGFKKFLLKRCLDKKVHLKELEMYCLKCRKAVNVKEVQIIDKGITIGNGVKQYIASGKCNKCGQTTNRFITTIPTQWLDIKIQEVTYRPKIKLTKIRKITFKISKESVNDQLSFIKSIDTYE